jgi:hypothetical protein
MVAVAAADNKLRREIVPTAERMEVIIFLILQ